MYQLAIFDLDGTLLDTIKDLSFSCNYALRSCGFKEHDIETYKTYVGNGVYTLVERALPVEVRNKETILKVKAVFDAHYKEHSEDYTKPYEGILTLLDNLRKKGIHCAVVSNKTHDFTVELVERMFEGKIELAYGKREGIPLKPSPEGVLEVIRHFNLPKEACIYIGDSNVDMLTAKNAKVTSVGVLWGFRSLEELKEAGAQYLAKDTIALEAIITKTKEGVRK